MLGGGCGGRFVCAKIENLTSCAYLSIHSYIYLSISYPYTYLSRYKIVRVRRAWGSLATKNAKLGGLDEW